MLILLCLASACSSHKEKQRAGPCDRAAAAAQKREPHLPLHGDVTGDGRPDTVALVAVHGAPAKCALWLVVKSREHIRPLALREQRENSFVRPALSGLGPIDRRAGLEIVAKLHEGASTEFAAVFSVAGDAIRQLVLDRLGYSEFGFGGSVTHADAVDCVHGAPGEVVQHGAGSEDPTGQRWVIEQRIYRVVGTQFVPLRTTTRRVRSPEAALRTLGRGPQPFPSCLAVRSH